MASLPLRTHVGVCVCLLCVRLRSWGTRETRETPIEVTRRGKWRSCHRHHRWPPSHPTPFPYRVRVESLFFKLRNWVFFFYDFQARQDIFMLCSFFFFFAVTLYSRCQPPFIIFTHHHHIAANASTKMGEIPKSTAGKGPENARGIQKREPRKKNVYEIREPVIG